MEQNKQNDPDYIPPGQSLPEFSGRHPAPYELAEKAGSHELEGQFGEEKVEHVKAVDETAKKPAAERGTGTAQSDTTATS